MTTTATINDLDPHTKYGFEVQGINNNGQEGPSERLNVTTNAPTGKLAIDINIMQKFIG